MIKSAYTQTLGITAKEAIASIKSQKLFKRALRAGWIVPHIQGSRGKSSIYKTQDVERLFDRLGKEQPPLLPCERKVTSAFSLPEILGVIAIILILTTIALPAFALNRCASAEIAFKRECQTLNSSYQNYIAAGGAVLPVDAPTADVYAALQGKVGNVGPFLVMESATIPNFKLCSGPASPTWTVNGFGTPTPTPAPVSTATPTPSPTATPIPTPSITMTITAPDYVVGAWQPLSINIHLSASEPLQNVSVTAPIPSNLQYTLPTNYLSDPPTMGQFNEILWRGWEGVGTFTSNEEAVQNSPFGSFSTIDAFLAEMRIWFPTNTFNSLTDVAQMFLDNHWTTGDSFSWTGDIPSGGIDIALDAMTISAATETFAATASSSVGIATASAPIVVLSVAPTPIPTPTPTPSPTPVAAFNLVLNNNATYGISVPSLGYAQIVLTATSSGEAEVNFTSSLPVVWVSVDGATSSPASSTTYSWKGLMSTGQVKRITLGLFAGYQGTYTSTATGGGHSASIQMEGIDGKALAYELVQKANAARSLGYTTNWTTGPGMAFFAPYTATQVLLAGVNGISMPEWGNPSPGNPSMTWANTANYANFISVVAGAPNPDYDAGAPELMADIPASITFQHWINQGSSYEMITEPIEYDYAAKTFYTVYPPLPGLANPGRQDLDTLRLQDGDIVWTANGNYNPSSTRGMQVLPDTLVFVNNPVSFSSDGANQSIVAGWQNNYVQSNGNWTQVSSSYANPYQ